MNPDPDTNLPSIDLTLINLLRIEIEAQVRELNRLLLELEKDPANKKWLDGLMRAAHSIKGAVSVVNLNPVVGKMAHAMEDFFVAAQKDQLEATSEKIDIVLRAIDLLVSLAKEEPTEIKPWLEKHENLFYGAIDSLEQLMLTNHEPALLKQNNDLELPLSLENGISTKDSTITPFLQASKKQAEQDRILRVTAEHLNQLIGMSGEFLVQSLWLQPFLDRLINLKKEQYHLLSDFEVLKEELDREDLSESVTKQITQFDHRNHQIINSISERIAECETFVRRQLNLSGRLYEEVVSSRIRPFSDAVEGLPRMVRDLARELGKKVKMELIGKSTPVDRDILEKLEAPLSHLLRNAVDHGIETPQVRAAAGKPEEGTIRIEAAQRSGSLEITVSDDGEGVDMERLRKKIVDSKLATLANTQNFSEEEAFEFLFVPGFSTSKSLTEISGRGIGLNLVQNMALEVGGQVKFHSSPGKGSTINLRLPLTLSVIRALIVEIAGEPYAIPLSRIDQVQTLVQDQLQHVDNRWYTMHNGKKAGVVSADRLLELEGLTGKKKNLSIIILSKSQKFYGLLVDEFLDERELVVRELDHQLGKIPDVAAGALLPDGSPILILDVEDMLRSIEMRSLKNEKFLSPFEEIN